MRDNDNDNDNNKWRTGSCINAGINHNEYQSVFALRTFTIVSVHPYWV